MSVQLDVADRDILAYYHLTDCDWVHDPRRSCSCGLLARVRAIAEEHSRQAVAS